MKKISLAIAATLTFFAAAPVIAQEADAAGDPFIATQGLDTTTLAVVGGVTLLILIAAASNDSSSGTD